jgi:hypothetical protein
MRRGRPGLIGTVARTAVIAGTAQMTSNAINKRAYTKQEQAMMAQQQAAQDQAAAMQAAAAQAVAAQQAAAPPPPPPAATPAGDDMISKITELAKLKDAGVLSEEEFAAAKARLLTG